jgi:phosphoglycolate phosphatase-like HAD superfamily hydrolase
VSGVTERHLVWDWNGTLLDDLAIVVGATNATFARVGGPAVTAEQHRRQFRRPIADYYAEALGRPVTADEFALLNKVFHDAYQAALPGCGLALDARDALRTWEGTQSLLSMWYHHELVPTVDSYRLTGHFVRVEGLPHHDGGAFDHKGPLLSAHLGALGVDPTSVVLVGDSVDDAVAARSAGAACVLYSGGFTAADKLRETGAPVVDSLIDAINLARAV